MTIDEFRAEYLDLLARGQEYDIYGYKPAGVLQYLQDADPQAVNIIRTRASTRFMSSKRCHKAMHSKSGAIWQLTTDGGARFLYFQDGPRHFVFVGASWKVKEKKFHIEVERAEQLRTEYLKIKEEKVR